MAYTDLVGFVPTQPKSPCMDQNTDAGKDQADKTDFSVTKNKQAYVKSR
jgi:hypothetical protein